MAKEYEIMLVFSVKDGEEAAKELLGKFTALIEKHGTLGEIDEWVSAKWLTLFRMNRMATMLLSITVLNRISRLNWNADLPSPKVFSDSLTLQSKIGGTSYA